MPSHPVLQQQIVESNRRLKSNAVPIGTLSAIATPELIHFCPRLKPPFPEHLAADGRGAAMRSNADLRNVGDCNPGNRMGVLLNSAQQPLDLAALW